MESTVVTYGSVLGWKVLLIEILDQKGELPTFEFAAIFLPFFLSSQDRNQKSVVDKDKTQKVRIEEPRPFLGDFWAT